jgi:hypothetical protein
MGELRYSSTIPDLGTRWRWSASLPGRFNPGKRAHGTHWIRGWVDPRADPDAVEKRKCLPLLGPAVQPVARRYID